MKLNSCWYLQAFTVIFYRFFLCQTASKDATMTEEEKKEYKEKKRIAAKASRENKKQKKTQGVKPGESKFGLVSMHPLSLM